MIAENAAEFAKAGIVAWHKAGYKGRGIKVAVIEPSIATDSTVEGEYFHFLSPPSANADGHNISVGKVVHEAAPEAQIYFITSKDFVKYCESNPAFFDLANVSMSTSNLKDCKKYGVPMICATGNGGKPDRIAEPARYDWTIAVGAWEESRDTQAIYSNGGEQIDCVGYTNIYVPTGKGDLLMFNGTSAATPFVTGMLALYLSKAGRKSVEELRQVIRENCRDVLEVGKDSGSGWGLFVLPDLDRVGGEEVRIQMQLGSRTAYVDGEKVVLDVAPFEQNGRTLVPVRFVAEALGCRVAYDEKTRGISITK